MTRGIRKKERKKSPSADDPIRRPARGGIKGSGATDSTKEGRKFDEAEKEIRRAALRFEALLLLTLQTTRRSVDRSVQKPIAGWNHFFLSSCAVVAALHRESENRGRSGRTSRDGQVEPPR